MKKLLRLLRECILLLLMMQAGCDRAVKNATNAVVENHLDDTKDTTRSNTKKELEILDPLTVKNFEDYTPIHFATENGVIVEEKYSIQADLKYLSMLPKGYDENSKAKYPMIMELHGGGTTKISALVKGGVKNRAYQDENFPFIVVIPLCPRTLNWNYVTQPLVALLDEINSNYNIDTDRVYLTGGSMGGFGTWALAMSHPERFAAVAPRSGAGDPRDVENIKLLPVWAFHGAKDTTVPVQMEILTVEALKKVGGNVKFTIYEDMEHVISPRVFRESGVLEWFLEHTRNPEIKAVTQEVHPEIVDIEDVKLAYCMTSDTVTQKDALNMLKKWIDLHEMNKLTDVKSYDFIPSNRNERKIPHKVAVTVGLDAQETDGIKIESFPKGKYAVLRVRSEEVKNNIMNMKIDQARAWAKLYKWAFLNGYKLECDTYIVENVLDKNTFEIIEDNVLLPLIKK